MIERFELGKRYYFTGATQFNTWNLDMVCILDGKSRLCTKAGNEEEHKNYALFEGMQKHMYQDGMYNWVDGFEFWEEDTTPKRGDKVIVWDDACVKSIYDFVAYVEGAKLPYLVTTDITKELFECLIFTYCIVADVKLLALSRVCKETSEAFCIAETAYDKACTAYDKASDDYSNHIAKLKEKAK